MKFFVTGDSHTAALKRGHASLKADGRLPPGVEFEFRPFGNAGLLRQPFFERRIDHVEVTEPSYRKRVPRLPAEGFAADEWVIAISGYFHFSGLWTVGLWRQGWLPGGGPPGRGRAFSPGMIGAVALHRMRYLLELGATLRELGCRVCALEAPGPFPHDPALQRTPAARVNAVRLACRGAMQHALDELGIPVIAVPAACRGADGVLEDALRNEDPADAYHAGAAFGATMLEAMLTRYACPLPINGSDPHV